MYSDLFIRIKDVINCWADIRNSFLNNPEFIEAHKDVQEIEILKKQESYTKLVESYGYVKNHGSIREFCEIINESINNEIFCSVYSILMEIELDELIVEMMYDWILESDVNVFEKETLMYIIKRKCFLKNTDIDNLYAKCRKIKKKMLSELNAETQIVINKIPYAERNHKKIVLLSDQILSEKHAPTRMVFSVKEALIELGYDVEVFCTTPYIIREQLSKCFGVGPYNGDNLIGSYELEFKTGKEEVFYLPFREENILFLTQLYKEIEMAKPELVWAIGGDCVALDFLSQMTTSLSMPCINGYSNLSSDYMISYMGQGMKKAKVQEIYLQSHNQKNIHIRLPYDKSIQRINKCIRRSDLEISEEAFVISIMGNRLDIEITEEFIEVMKKIEFINEKIEYIFIGDMNRLKIEVLKSELSSNLHFMGFLEFPQDILSICNVMINPPRTGGGGGARMAIFSNVPCISLKNCDVSSTIGNENCEDNLLGFVKEIKLLIDKPGELRRKLDSQLEYFSKNQSSSLVIEIKNMLSDIIDNIKNKCS